jgi:hypothetical protein
VTVVGLIAVVLLGAIWWGQYRYAKAATESSKTSAEALTAFAVGFICLLLGLTAAVVLNIH